MNAPLLQLLYRVLIEVTGVTLKVRLPLGKYTAVGEAAA